MAKNGTIAYISEAKPCDFPHKPGTQPDAEYDFRTTNGQWANGCDDHYKQFRMHKDLGVGMGQKLEVTK